MNTYQSGYPYLGILIFVGMFLIAFLNMLLQARRQLKKEQAELDAQLGDEIRETADYIFRQKRVCPLARAQVHRASEHFNAARRLGQQGGSAKEIVVLLNLGLDQVSQANTSAALFLLQNKTPGRVPPSLQDLALWNSEPHDYAVLTSLSGLEDDFKYAGGTVSEPPSKLLTLAQALAVAAQFEVGDMLTNGENSQAQARIVNIRTGQIERVFAPSAN
jgi:hypothetical protein